jgi:Na+/melibiose symporter-like transporter
VIFLLDNQSVGTAALNEKDFEKEVEQEVEKLSTGNRRYLRPREIVAFLLTTFGQKNLAQFVDANRQFFMISFLGITGKAYGIIVALESLYDALDDSLSGLIIDRTRTRWGRLRPYMIITVPVWGIAALMLFSAPAFGSGTAGTIVWAVAAIFLYNLGMSYFGAWNILLYNITPNIKERDSLIATSKFFELFGMWLPSLLPVVLRILKGKVGMQSIYSGFAISMVAVAAVTAIYGFFAMRERVPLASREQMQEIGIIESFKNAVKNKPMLISVIANFFGSFKSVGGATESFFWYHNTGDLFHATIAGLFTGIPNYIITPLTPKLIRRFGARNTSIGAGVFGGVAYTLMFIIGYQPFGAEGVKWQGTNLVLNLTYLTIMLTICGLPNCILRVCAAVLQGDVYDYSEWKYGVRNEALVQTITNYFGKLSNAVTGLLSGLVITLVGYVAHKDALGNIIQETSPTVLNGFFAVFALLPAFARLFNGLTWIFFPVHGKFKQNMLAELEERRAERVEEEESETEDK